VFLGASGASCTRVLTRERDPSTGLGRVVTRSENGGHGCLNSKVIHATARGIAEGSGGDHAPVFALRATSLDHPLHDKSFADLHSARYYLGYSPAKVGFGSLHRLPTSNRCVALQGALLALAPA
jgi:hypothetical protein